MVKKKKNPIYGTGSAGDFPTLLPQKMAQQTETVFNEDTGEFEDSLIDVIPKNEALSLVESLSKRSASRLQYLLKGATRFPKIAGA